MIIRKKWAIVIFSGILFMSWISCQRAEIRRNDISCKPPSEISAGATGKITIAWDLNEKEQAAGFRIFYGLASRKYQQCIDIGRPPESSPGVVKYTLTGLDPGKKYYIALIAYDKNKNESDFSGEVSGTAE